MRVCRPPWTTLEGSTSRRGVPLMGSRGVDSLASSILDSSSRGDHPSPPAVPRAVVAGGDFRVRLLLRGLLQMHHVLLDEETEDLGRAVDLIRLSHPDYILIYTGADPDVWCPLIENCRSICPRARVILVRPAGTPSLRGLELSRSPDVLLREPYTLLEFAMALYSHPLEFGKAAVPIARESNSFTAQSSSPSPSD